MPDNIGEGTLAELMASGGGSAAPGASSASAAPAALAVGGGGAGGVGARLNPRALGRARSNCFSADTTVRTYSGLKTMKELEVGDYVRCTIALSFPLLFFSFSLIHYCKKKPHIIYMIEIESNDH